MQEKEELKQYLIDHLDEAIEKHYLQVYYQPVIRTLTGRLCGAEALIRWIDPVKGFLSPDDFIPLFEEMNLSYKVDRYVIQEVTQGLRGRIDKGEKLVPVSINLSRADGSFDRIKPGHAEKWLALVPSPRGNHRKCLIQGCCRLEAGHS
ncbi:hypothetical protein ME790_17710 [Lactobacillus delbrueckii]|uniref:EAL domain-containing protein n=1 Tax=Lactobacillus delbrueckii TaxID=1584 RepID=UPI0020869D73|nr:EAL domain-containing protein [Lactobacillus delbrueckii]GHN32700.1 hypothetical protein ME790_17710 [Lactobacillus delbrueckii]